MSVLKRIKETGSLWTLKDQPISHPWAVNCQHPLWAAQSCSRLSLWVSGAGPGALPLYSSASSMSRASSFLLQPVMTTTCVTIKTPLLLQILECLNNKWLDVSLHQLLRQTNTCNEVFAAKHLGQTSKLWNVQFVILSKQCENLQKTKAPRLSDACTVQGRRSEGPFSEMLVNWTTARLPGPGGPGPAAQGCLQSWGWSVGAASSGV